MFSIVIPLYNKAQTIENTLASVLNQKLQEFEVVIVNDGSTDNGVSVVSSFTSDPRVRILDQENQGVSAARNQGVKCARYDFIAFLDGDDEWLPDYLATMRTAIEKFPIAGMYCCAGYVKDRKKTSLRLVDKYKNKIIRVEYFENPHVYTHISATVVSKAFFLKTSGFPVGMTKNEDFAFLFAVALQGDVIYCGYPLSIYWGDVPGQTTATNREDGGAIQCVIRRINLCHESWLETRKANKFFRVFEKYELRHIILGFIKRKEYEKIEIMLSNLSKDVTRGPMDIEKYLWRSSKLRCFAIIYLYLTKILWRANRFPVVRK